MSCIFLSCIPSCIFYMGLHSVWTPLARSVIPHPPLSLPIKIKPPRQTTHDDVHHSSSTLLHQYKTTSQSHTMLRRRAFDAELKYAIGSGWYTTNRYEFNTTNTDGAFTQVMHIHRPSTEWHTTSSNYDSNINFWRWIHCSYRRVPITSDGGRIDIFINGSILMHKYDTT